MMISATPATPGPVTPDPAAIAGAFSSIAADLAKGDATIDSMVAKASQVGTGWGPYMGAIAARMQDARDGLMDVKPDAAALAAKLGADVIKLAEAAGGLTIIAQQRATLSTGWATFLDSAIANAKEAAALLAPPAPTPAPVPPATPSPTPAPALAP